MDRAYTKGSIHKMFYEKTATLADLYNSISWVLKQYRVESFKYIASIFEKKWSISNWDNGRVQRILLIAIFYRKVIYYKVSNPQLQIDMLGAIFYYVRT